MFLLVFSRHVGAHPDGHQHGVSIQISINLGETLLRIARELKTAEACVAAAFILLFSRFNTCILSIRDQRILFIYFAH